MKISTTEAARLLGMTRQRVQQLCKASMLKAEKFGRFWMVDADAVELYPPQDPNVRGCPRGTKRT